jgi:hypothetical protein
MSQYNEIGALGALNDAVYNLSADNARRVVIGNITGTFVGTIKGQTSDDGKTWTDATVVNMQTGATGNPTAPGNYSFPLGASGKKGRFIFSAYTSGSAKVKVTDVAYI